MPELNFAGAIKTNVLQLGALTMEAFNDRLLVIEDEFRSGYECPDCVGKKKIKSPELEELVCENCDGSGKSVISKEARCSACRGLGRTICKTCLGKGGVIVVAQASERRPTTGTVVSTGDKVQHAKRGESVIYTSFSGHVYDLELPGGETIVIRVIQESDILAKVSGHLELRRVKKSQAVGTAA
jgi:co-chaperonin GroES (HSP10)